MFVTRGMERLDTETGRRQHPIWPYFGLLLVTALLLANLIWLPSQLHGSVYGAIPITRYSDIGADVVSAGAENGQDRSWLAYDLIRRHYGGWPLISHDYRLLVFSDMYAMTYSGAAGNREVVYDPALTEAEAADLRSRPYREVDIGRLGHLRLLYPPSDARRRVALMLRQAEDSHVLVPIELAPPRFRELINAH